MKAPGSLKLFCTIPINKQVSKRGQITVKPNKDGCCWNNPWRLENQRAFLFPKSLFLYPTQGSLSGLTHVHPTWCLGSCREPPRPYSSCCGCSNCARNVGGRKCQIYVDICSEKLYWSSDEFFLFCSIPLLNPYTWLRWVTNELWRLGKSSIMQHLCSVYFALSLFWNLFFLFLRLAPSAQRNPQGFWPSHLQRE